MSPPSCKKCGKQIKGNHVYGVRYGNRVLKCKNKNGKGCAPHRMHARVVKAPRPPPRECVNEEEFMNYDLVEDIPTRFRISVFETQRNGKKLRYCFDIRYLMPYLAAGNVLNPHSQRSFTQAQLDRIHLRAVQSGFFPPDQSLSNRQWTRSR